MVASKSKSKKEKKAVIPAYLIYEMLDGIPVYYRGYKDVLNKTKTLEEIMAYGELQAILLTFIREYLAKLLGKEYFIIQGETGVHMEHLSNPSLDLCVFLRSDISYKEAQNKYFSKVPILVVEVDTKADVTTFETSKGNYYIAKTKRLLEFGVESVIWVFTEDQKITVARPNQPWLTVDWKDTIEVMGHSFSLQQIIDASEG